MLSVLLLTRGVGDTNFPRKARDGMNRIPILTIPIFFIFEFIRMRDSICCIFGEARTDIIFNIPVPSCFSVRFPVDRLIRSAYTPIANLGSCLTSFPPGK
mgnify:CR=1 FL=1